MITDDRAEHYKKQALRSVESRARNLAAPGIATVQVTPHDLLDLLKAREELEALKAMAPGGADV